MQNFFQSLSLTWTVVLVAGVSALAALVLGRLRRVTLRWILAVLVPFALSYCVYWLPLWLGADGDGAQYSAWELLGVGAPFLAGLVVSCSVTFIVVRYAKQHD